MGKSYARRNRKQGGSHRSKRLGTPYKEVRPRVRRGRIRDEQ